jgi:hypothetical protein
MKTTTMTTTMMMIIMIIQFLIYQHAGLTAQGQLQNQHTVYKVNRTNIQNTLISKGPILEQAQYVQN